jgi:hypothetical protein
VEQVVEGLLPARAERRDIGGGTKLFDVASGQVEQGVDVSDADCVPSDPSAHDLVTRLDMTFGDHPQVEAWTVVGDEQGG